VRDARGILEKELDFDNERRNGERTRVDLALAAAAADDSGVSRTALNVHVPVADCALSTQRILTTEFIDGVKPTE
jgi:predicted unusual protein kinase regulating ubiquinone biosynthesis (AarF/ABC1/UbiB family)